jgi:hypothetical protein
MNGTLAGPREETVAQTGCTRLREGFAGGPFKKPQVQGRLEQAGPRSGVAEIKRA